MKILALLQNQWVRDPARVKAMYDRTPDQRLRLNALLLFGGRGLTGRRLHAAFGDWCARIAWENVSREITARPDATVTGHVVHVDATLHKVDPDLVIVFGQIAQQTLAETSWTGPTIVAPHPARRDTNVQEQLRGVRIKLERAVRQHEGARL